jgi:hypothetical protein
MSFLFSGCWKTFMKLQDTYLLETQQPVGIWMLAWKSSADHTRFPSPLGLVVHLVRLTLPWLL